MLSFYISTLTRAITVILFKSRGGALLVCVHRISTGNRCAWNVLTTLTGTEIAECRMAFRLIEHFWEPTNRRLTMNSGKRPQGLRIQATIQSDVQPSKF